MIVSQCTLFISSAHLHAIIQFIPNHFLVLDLYCYIFYKRSTFGLSASVIFDRILGYFLPMTFFQIPTKEVPRATYVWEKHQENIFLNNISPSDSSQPVFSTPFSFLHPRPTYASDPLAIIGKYTLLRVYLQVSVLLMCCRAHVCEMYAGIVYVKMHKAIWTSFNAMIYHYIFDTAIALHYKNKINEYCKQQLLTGPYNNLEGKV